MWKNSFVLTKKDILIIDEIANRNAKKAVTEGIISFWETILEPYLSSQSEKNEQEHNEIIKEVKLLKKNDQSLQEETFETREYIAEHDKRIEALEKRSLLSSNT